MELADSSVIRIYLLGRFEVSRGKRILRADDWNRQKAAALFKRLAWERKLLKEIVVDHLWPDADLTNGANNLYRALHEIRRTLDTHLGKSTADQVISFSDGILTLSNSIWVDAHEYENAAKQSNIQHLITNYTGDFLPDDLYEDWAQTPREHLHQLYREAVLTIVEEDPNTATGLLMALLARDPLDEPVHRALMKAYALTGRRPEAVRQYQTCKDVLEANLGISPDSQTTTLYDQILRGEVVARLPETSVNPSRSGLESARRPIRATNDFVHELNISMFGPPQIHRRKGPVSIQRRKDLALFAYLAVTGQQHSRDVLATLLWADIDQPAARANLRKSLSRLKGELGEDVLLVTQDQVGLNSNFPLWLDVARFRSCIKQPREHGHILQGKDQPLCDSCQAALEEAVHLYQGEFLQGFSLPDSPTFEEWQFFQSEGYRQNLGEALQFLIQQYIDCEQYPLAIEHGRKWLAMDTLHEPAHRQLMLSYALSRQQSAALRQFEECSRLLKKELGVEPEPETVELNVDIRQKRIAKQKDAQRQKISQAKKKEQTKSAEIRATYNHNLPVQPTAFIGRTKELNTIQKLLEDPSCSLITLLGPGGSGKTRLAIQAGLLCNQENRFKDGVCLIQLAPLTEHTSIIPAIGKELGLLVISQQGDQRQQLFDYLHGRQTLLILDNFEHLLGSESLAFITGLIKNAPTTKLLLTSRERLNIQGEQLFPVEGLEIPSDAALLFKLETAPDPHSFSAIQLFEQSARRVQPSFEVIPDNFAAISQICQHVQGMPLAIELAASWIEILSVDEINREIKQDLDFLQSELHDIPNRQRSLRAVFDSSWNKLTKTTRSTIKALSVFRSSFTRQAAQAITGLSIKTLLELTNKSWIQPQADGRYQIHELLRQFAFEKLERDPITFQQVVDLYCSYYSNYLSSLWKIMKGPRQGKVFSDLKLEFENVRTAWMWLAAKRDYELAVKHMLPVLFNYAEVREKVFDLLDMIDRMLKTMNGSAQDKDQQTAEIILRTAQGAFYSDERPVRYKLSEGLFPIDREGIQQTWELSQKSVELHELGFWGILLAFNYGSIINSQDAVKHLKQALQYFRTDNKLWELATGELHLAMLLLIFEVGGKWKESADRYLSEALDIFDSMGDEVSAGHTLSMIGYLRLKEENPTEAIQQWKAAQSRLLREDIDEWSAASIINWHLGDAYLQLGQFNEAFQTFQEISRVNLENGFIQAAVGALSKESFEKARYGELSEAMRIRRQCLDLIQRRGSEYQIIWSEIAWSEWEMGELMRLSGNYKDAIDWYKRSYEKFDTYHDYVGLSFYWRGLGDLSLIDKDFATAKQRFERSVQLARQAQHSWIIAYSLTGLGKAEFGLNDIMSATGHFNEALQLARKTRDTGINLLVLNSIARLFAQTGRIERAAELGGLVLSHFASWNEIKGQASVWIAALEQRMPSKTFNELQKRGRSLDLWETVDQVIIDLEE